MKIYSKKKHHWYSLKNISRDSNSEKWKEFLNKAIYFIGIVGPVLVLPQLLKIWTTKDASGLSLITWTLWIFVDSIWIMYGFVHKILPIVFSHSAYIFTQIGVVTGILLYG
jgi:uncharacterized protein with PQ loop repeat